MLERPLLPGRPGPQGLVVHTNLRQRHCLEGFSVFTVETNTFHFIRLLLGLFVQLVVVVLVGTAVAAVVVLQCTW